MIHNATRMVRAALAVGAVLLIPLAGVSLWWRGEAGMWTAVGSMAVVVGGFVLSGLVVRETARRWPAMVAAAIVISFLARMALYVALVVLLAPRDVVDGPTLAVVVPVTVIVLLTAEALIARQPDFRLIDPAPLVPDAKELT